MVTKWLGKCFGIEIFPRNSTYCVKRHTMDKTDNHVMIRILVEDDGIWHEKESFSSFWIDELIDVLKEARKDIKKHCEPDMYNDYSPPRQFGYKFKK